MNYDFQLYQAKFNYLAETLLEEYQQNRNRDNLTKCSLLWEMYYYTNNLQANNNILENKYREETHDLLKQLKQLKEKYEELHNTIRFSNLGSERFSDKNA